MNWLMTFSIDDARTANYVAWLREAGIAATVALPGAPPPSPTGFDALLLSGGGDVDPAWYGEPRHPATGNVDRAWDEFESALFHAFRQAGRPVFGVCRGVQLINVLLGGKLIQHVPDYLDAANHAAEEHRHLADCDSRHDLLLLENHGLGAALAGATDVNSSHHQALHPDHLGHGLRMHARSAAGIIEAVESAEALPAISAVQWHPERLTPPQHPARVGLIQYWRALTRQHALLRK